MQQALQNLTEHLWYKSSIFVLLFLNILTFGLETSHAVNATVGAAATHISRGIFSALIIDIILRVAANGTGFFRSAWNIFELAVTALALTPGFRAIVLLRTLRLGQYIQFFPDSDILKQIIHRVVSFLPSLVTLSAMIFGVFYIYAVMATHIFAADFPEYFGSIVQSMQTLTQVMTGESWGSMIARPVLQAYPYAWLFFISFILIITFTVLHLFIAILINAVHEERRNKRAGDPEGFDPTPFRGAQA